MCLDTLVQYAEIANPIIAFIGLGAIGVQLFLNRKQARLERSYQFAGKYYEPDYLPHMIRARKFLASDQTIGYKWYLFNNDENTRVDLGIFLSFFEEIGAMYNMGLVDKDVINNLLKPPIIAYFDLARPFINRMRESRTGTNEPPIYEQWETMYNILR